MGKLSQRLYEACLNATGAYEALKLVGAHSNLPGYDRCLEDLNKIIDEYKANSYQRLETGGDNSGIVAGNKERVGMITELILKEARERPGPLDRVGKIHQVVIDVSLEIMSLEIMEIMRQERKRERK